MLTGRNPQSQLENYFITRDLSTHLPEGCVANFDLRLMDVFEEMRKHDPLPERMKTEYMRLEQT